MIKIFNSKHSQIWVETVIYTLIGLSIIGVLLAVLKPTIESTKDRLLIEQIIEILNTIDSKIYEVQRAPGNKRAIDIKISKGNLIIDSENNKISWILDSRYEYSEPGLEVNLGNIKINTEEKGDSWPITLSLDYDDKNINLTYSNLEELKEFTPAPSLYSLYIENKGPLNDKLVINIDSE